MLNKIKELISWIDMTPIYIVGGIITIVFIIILTRQTPEEKLQEVIDEYNGIKTSIISTANANVEWGKLQVLELTKKLSKTRVAIKLNEQCIKVNKRTIDTIQVAIDCNTITIEKPKKKVEHTTWWRLNSNWKAQQYIELKGNTITERMNDLLINYWRTEDVAKKRWERVWKKHWIKPEVLVCIAKADSSLGRELKSKNNIGNVGNNDRWNTVNYATPIQWIEAMGKVLNNKYLWYKQSIGSLSVWWGWDSPVYATSFFNWNMNVINCLGMIHNKKIDENFMFRIWK